jgi:HSP20 family protein
MAMGKVSSAVHFTLRSTTEHPHEAADRARWVPNTDVYATDGGLVIKVELAGLRSENLEINVEGNRLRISGTRPDGCRASTCNFIVMEINYGAFETVLELPPGYDLSKAKASYLNGFLRIDVPIAAPSKSKSPKVSVKGAR